MFCFNCYGYMSVKSLFKMSKFALLKFIVRETKLQRQILTYWESAICAAMLVYNVNYILSLKTLKNV